MVTITLTGRDLSPEQVLAIADAGARVEIDGAAWHWAETGWETARRLVERQPVYGQTTGVGANRSQHAADDGEHGRRLIRSHAAGAGPIVSERQARAMLAIRANQLLRGCSGAHPRIVGALVDALNAGVYPRMHAYGGIGTGDLTALAETALALVGERRWLWSERRSESAERTSGPDALSIDGPRAGVPAIELGTSDALPFLSSNALTLGRASLAYAALSRLAEASCLVTALTFAACRGSAEPYAAEVHSGRWHAGTAEVARRMWSLVSPAGQLPARVQDPFGLRAFPQVHGVAWEALDRLREALLVDMNAAAENPLFAIEADEVFHHGNWHHAALTMALDDVRLAVHSSANLSSGRTAMLMEPRWTELPAFLADGPGGSSGAMMLEYTTAGALAELRGLAMPTSLGSVSLSRGVEDHASFATQAADWALRVVDGYRVVLAAELVAAVRALRLRDFEPAAAPTLAAYRRAAAALPDDLGDRPLDADMDIATELLTELPDALGNEHEGPDPSQRTETRPDAVA